MFLSMQLLCFYKQPPSLFLVHNNEGILKHKRLITNPYFSTSDSCFGVVHASVKEDSQSQQYEIEPEKAREALKKLDEQMQSLSNKPSKARKLKVSDLKLPVEVGSDKETLEITDSFLATVAGGLVLFTILYNVLFYTVIKPGIDGS
ncbi:unnamed protein product [Sphenostylis stenocarpa]|uniref:Uncharacterized protein n=1 Tax=Sphenostylis stenocarpa TaxID=92480 RepID=A0AA86SLE0_9FABA|nr:unnamed protein product [Sphenostylis stenocarpa]